MTLVRSAALSDLSQVFPLACDFATSFRPERASFDAVFPRLIAQEHALLLIAEEQGDVLGYLLGFDHETFFANGRVSWVEEVMVREDRRREGIGETLMERFEEWAKSRDSKLVALATRRASPFYMAIGYEDSATYFRKLI